MLCEVGPRDGFQFEDQFIPTRVKAEVIEALADAGLRRIQVTSFVHPRKVPQMKDAEEVVDRLPEREGVTYAGLALNQRGLERLRDAGLEQADLSIATHDRHSRDNAGMSATKAAAEAEEMTQWALARDLSVQMGFQTVFGYEAPGDTPLAQVTALAERFAQYPLESLSLADTTGMANPQMVRRRVEAVREAAPGVPLVLHLHDTRGLGLANVCAALEAGVERFDTSLAGMGGCPFVHGAAGNVATEDTAYLFEQLGRNTSVDYRRVAAAARRVEDLLEKRFPGKLHRLPFVQERAAGAEPRAVS
jgi:hydroxymethylglutaryl-CoA lyase